MRKALNKHYKSSKKKIIQNILNYLIYPFALLTPPLLLRLSHDFSHLPI